MPIYRSIAETIGNTPTVELTRYAEKFELNARIAAKLEYFNPAGSAKDRVAYAMISDAEKNGVLKLGATIIEPTSGNTGIGLACIGAAKGYRVILTMPDTMSAERINLIKAYGAEIVLTDGKKGMSGAIEKARELAAEIEGSFIPDQFSNPANPDIHYKTTGPEIWRDTLGKVDAFVSGVGTGGTISGVGKFLKGMNPAIKIVAVEPLKSAVLSGGKAGAHGIQGIGAGFVPANLDCGIYDEVFAVADEDAFECARELGKTEGFLTGISSGAALAAATAVARRPESKGKLIVVLLPDTGDRYLSTSLFSY
jgi:cysteine synthase A